MSDNVTTIKEIQPTKTVRFVRVEDGFPNVYDLPIEKNFNDGTGVLFYHNLGFIEHSKWLADQHAKAVAEKQAKEAAEKEAKEAAAKSAGDKIEESEPKKKGSK